MITTSEFALLHQRKQLSVNFQNLVFNVTTLWIELILLTFYASDFTHEVAYSDKRTDDVIKSLIDKIDQAKGLKIVSESYKKREDLAELIPQKMALSSYFTKKNETESPVVLPEKKLLVAHGYNINKGYYFAIPFPPGVSDPEGVFFLLAKNIQEAELIEKNMKTLLEKIVENCNSRNHDMKI